jgi:hypothetical protein
VDGHNCAVSSPVWLFPIIPGDGAYRQSSAINFGARDCRFFNRQDKVNAGLDTQRR